MNYRQIRNAIVNGLYNYLGTPVVPTDDVSKKPKYPYISYKFTTLRISQGSYNLLKDTIFVPRREGELEFGVEPSEYDYLEGLGSAFETDLEITREEQPKMVISFSTYSKDDVESYQLALEMESWFKFQGYEYLKENGIIVVDTSSIKDRTIRIVDNYERRQGFDVTIRVKDIQKITTPTIEKININRR